MTKTNCNLEYAKAQRERVKERLDIIDKFDKEFVKDLDLNAMVNLDEGNFLFLRVCEKMYVQNHKQ